MARRPEYRYYALRAVSTPGFMMPVSTLFLVSHEVSYATLGLAGAVTAAVVVLAEVPTGYLSDRVGRRATVAVSQALFATFPLVLVLSPDRTGTILGFAVLGLAETLQSGAVSAWCYDALEAADRADSYTRVASRGNAIRFATLAITAIAGGILYAVEPAYPLLAAVLMGALGIGFAASLSPTGEQSTGPDSQDRLGPWEAARIAREYLLLPKIRAFLLLIASVFAATRAVRAFVQPVAVDGLEGLLAGVTIGTYQVPETAVLGVAYAGFAAAASLGSDRASDVEAAVGTGPTVLVVTVFLGAIMLLPLLHPVLIVPAMVLYRGAGSMLVPIKNGYLNEHIEGVGRATILSAASLVIGLVKIPVTVGSGVVGDVLGPAVGIASLGGLVLVVSVGVHLVTSPVPAGAGVAAAAD